MPGQFSAKPGDSVRTLLQKIVWTMGGESTPWDRERDLLRKILVLDGGTATPYDNDVHLLRKIILARGGSYKETDLKNRLLTIIVLLLGGNPHSNDNENNLYAKWLSLQSADFWNPSDDAANLALWFSSDSGITLVGNEVSQWNDRSGNARHLTPAAATNRPKFTAGALNGLPEILFDGGNDYLQTGAFVLSQPFTCYFLARQVTYTQFERLFQGAAANDAFMHQSNVVAPNVSMRTGATTGPTFTTWTVGTYGILDGKWSGSGTKARFHQQTEVGGDPGTGGLTGFKLCANNAGGGIGNFGIVEVIFRSGLSDPLTSWRYYIYLAARAGFTVRQLTSEGDSITAGAGLGLTSLFPHKVVAAEAPTLWGYNNLAVGGSVVSDLVSRAGATNAYYDSRVTDNVLTVWAGSNDLVFGDSAATVFGKLASYCAARRSRGFHVLVFTILPRTAISGAAETHRQNLNTLIRDHWTGFADGLVDVAANGTLGAVNANLNLTYYIDGTHLTAAGHTIVATLAGAQLP